MKLKRIILIYFLLFITIQICFGQVETKPQLLDSFEPRNCESVLQRVEYLIEDVSKNPNSIGYIIINWRPKKANEFNFEGRLAGFYYEDVISVHLQNKVFDQNRIRIIRSDSDKLKIDFLITPDKSVEPSYVKTNWDLSIPKKAMIFDEGYGGQLCAETYFNLKVFSEFLTANPPARGHFVIYADSIKDFPKEKERIINEITKVGIPLNRFRFFFRKDNSTIHPYSKLWLVPNNKK
jgi:hypothetical protein